MKLKITVYLEDEWHLPPRLKALDEQGNEHLVRYTEDLKMEPMTTKDEIKMQLSDSSIQVRLYGNDGNDGQEVIKGDRAKEHLIKWIYNWMDKHAAQAIAEHEHFNFNKITDIRNHLLRHPDQDMIEASCLHYLGDSYNEQKQWKKYPENIPGCNGGYLLTFEDSTVYAAMFFDGYWTCNADPIAFRELPTPYKEDKKEGGEDGI